MLLTDKGFRILGMNLCFVMILDITVSFFSTMDLIK